MDGTFGVLLRAHRHEAGLTQEELAERSSLSAQAIGSLERGDRRSPRRETVLRLARALRLSEEQVAVLVAAATRRAATPPPAPVEQRTWWVAPRQLPPRLPGFTGRADLLAAVGDHLVVSTGVAVVAVSGMGGAGKTAAAVEIAYRVAAEFPDGHLFVDLGGDVRAGDTGPSVRLALAHLLSALDPGAGPVEDVEEAAARYRSGTAGRRVLLVLDNAVSTAQVLPLLPTGAGSAVLVTSRRSLVSLPGARHEDLGMLSGAEGVELLARIAGRHRVEAEPDAAAAVVRRCGGLPLAVHLVGARLATRPAWTVEHVAALLADEETRLDHLEAEDVAVRVRVGGSVDHLATSADPRDREAADAYPLLGLLEGPGLDAAVVGHLFGLDGRAAARVLDRLADLHLVEAREPGRYRIHDLLRVYVREVVSTPSHDHVRVAATIRLLEFYAAAAWRAQRLLYPLSVRSAWADDRWEAASPPFRDSGEAVEWLHREHLSFIPLLSRARADAGVPRELLVRFAVPLFGFYVFRGLDDDWVRVCEIARDAAREGTDRVAEALAVMDLGIATVSRDRAGDGLAAGIELVERGYARFAELGHRAGQAMCLTNLCHLFEAQGDIRSAIDRGERGLAIVAELDDPVAEAAAHENLGMLVRRLGDTARAEGHFERCLALSEGAGFDRGTAGALRLLALLWADIGRTEQAVEALERSALLTGRIGDGLGEATTRRDLGDLLLSMGDVRRGTDELRTALALAQRRGNHALASEILRTR
ncbi:NB-ARC domain-containing protein [Actinosynnema sp. NPDC050801]|uniref:NB-ARC domain-containing protein n=1 Tax=unclassified Actinosynnema TaxID=2637065 RepID=UPI0033E6A2AB